MGLIIGQIDIEIPSVLKAVFFALFIYSMALKNGPEFFGSLNRGNIKLVLLSVILCVTGLASILLMNTIFGFDASFAVGLGAGALTDTAMMWTPSSRRCGGDSCRPCVCQRHGLSLWPRGRSLSRAVLPAKNLNSGAQIKEI